MHRPPLGPADAKARPTLAHPPSASGPADAFFPPREGYLLNASAALLRLPTPRSWGDPRSGFPSAAGHVFRVCDYWMWDRSLLLAFFAHGAPLPPQPTRNTHTHHTPHTHPPRTPATHTRHAHPPRTPAMHTRHAHPPDTHLT